MKKSQESLRAEKMPVVLLCIGVTLSSCFAPMRSSATTGRRRQARFPPASRAQSVPLANLRQGIQPLLGGIERGYSAPWMPEGAPQGRAVQIIGAIAARPEIGIDPQTEPLHDRPNLNLLQVIADKAILDWGNSPVTAQRIAAMSTEEFETFVLWLADGRGLAMGKPSVGDLEPIGSIRAFEERRGHWQSLARARLGQTGGEIQWPESFEQQFSAQDHFDALEAMLKLKHPVFNAFAKLVGDIAAAPEARGSFEDLMRELRKHVIADYNQHYLSELNREIVLKGVATVGRLWEKFRGSTQLHVFKVEEFVQFGGLFKPAMDYYQAQFPNVINDKARQGAGFGFVSIFAFLRSLNLPLERIKAIAAISLLHPLTDNAIDAGEDVSKTLKKITILLRGQTVEAESEYEAAVFMMIRDILETYPPSEHPQLLHYLQKLHEAQILSSQRQRDPHVEEDVLWEVTLKKGGYTGLVYSYIALGELGPGEPEFFYHSGMVFQLGDDLLDVAEDLRDGTQTLWTRAHGNTEKLKRLLSKYMELERHLEEGSSRWLRHNQGIAPFVSMGFRFSLLSAFMRERMGAAFTKILQPKFPLSPKNLRSATLSLHQFVSRELDISSEALRASLNEFTAIFDAHFLKGMVADWRGGPQEPARRRYRVTTANPLFWAVRVSAGLHGYFFGLARDESPHRYPLVWWMLGLAFLHYWFLASMKDMVIYPYLCLTGLFLGAHFFLGKKPGFPSILCAVLWSIAVTSLTILKSMGFMP